MRRIEAVTGEAAEALAEERFRILEAAQAAVGAQTPDQLVARIEDLKEKGRGPRTPTGRLLAAQAAKAAEKLQRGALVSHRGSFRDMDELKAWARDVRRSLGSGVIAAALEDDEQPQLFVTVSDDLVEQGVDAATLVREALAESGGKGGGRAEMAQGRLPDPAALEAALRTLRDRLAG
jgi:alanyl-tRNA synthetase